MGTRLYREEIYQDDSGGWRWRVFAVNGENVGNSSESYDSEFNALRAWHKFLSEMNEMFTEFAPKVD